MNIIIAFRQQFFSKFYLFIPISIIALACLGSAAVYFITMKGNSPFNFFQTVVCVAGAMSYLAVLLAIWPCKVFVLGHLALFGSA